MQPWHGIARFAWHAASANEVCFSLGLIKHHLHVAVLLPTLDLTLPKVRWLQGAGWGPAAAPSCPRPQLGFPQQHAVTIFS